MYLHHSLQLGCSSKSQSQCRFGGILLRVRTSSRVLKCDRQVVSVDHWRARKHLVNNSVLLLLLGPNTIVTTPLDSHSPQP
mmetsp:Transcript_7841/g.17155  ORF Transcript_7841/g.17155 Transcript_7841/m.17155 type:complete len:81 (+) Transcript_7841:1103-1345(+)